MNLFSEIEKTIERGFRRWTDRMFGEANSDELLLIHRAILEQIESKVQVVSRGRRIFPYGRIAVTLISADPDRRAVYQSAFGERLDADVREALKAADCEMPRDFAVEVNTAEEGEGPFSIEFAAAPVTATPTPTPAPAQARVVVIKGKAAEAEYLLAKPRINIGRLAELTDSEQRVVRRNDIVFEETGDDANATVSRKHAHIRLDQGDYRICDDESEFGTRVFRDGRPIEVPRGARGEKLRPGDEIYLGRACIRFER